MNNPRAYRLNHPDQDMPNIGKVGPTILGMFDYNFKAVDTILHLFYRNSNNIKSLLSIPRTPSNLPIIHTRILP